MGKKTKFPFLFKAAETTASAAVSWPWPSCVNDPKTPSFRVNNDHVYKTFDSAYLDDNTAADISDRCPDYNYQHRPEEILSCDSETCDPDESAVISALRSDRLFFQPGETNSILEEARTCVDYTYKDGVAILAVDSRDPFLDFRLSMEEMVEALGLRDWDSLEELLACYLRLNCTTNHGYIVGAFVDLLIHLGLPCSSNSASAIEENCSFSSSTTSLLSFSSSTYPSAGPCLSSLVNEARIVPKRKGERCS